MFQVIAAFVLGAAVLATASRLAAAAGAAFSLATLGGYLLSLWNGNNLNLNGGLWHEVTASG